MYSDPRLNLNTPPPTSQFRRPWSPEPYDPLPSTSNSRNNQLQHDPYFQDQQQFQYEYEYPQYHQQQPRRREPSDVSVEALDLADYAMTLRPPRTSPYPAHYPQDMYPPSPPSLRPLPNPDSLQPPSLVSRGETLSSNNTHTTYSRNPSRRPHSLPSLAHHSNSSRTSHASPLSHSNQTHRYPHIAEPQIHHRDPEIDISKFPPWSRNWYNTGVKHLTPASPPDIYTALPTPHFDSAKRSPFDPSNINRHGYSSPPSDFYSDPYSYAPPSSHGHDSARDLLPWSNEPPEYGPPIDAALKGERMRMLEREFGLNAKGKGNAGGTEGAFVDEDGKPLIGTVDAKGQLITQGPKKRTATRFVQVLLALAAGVPSIYAALIIKPKTVPPPSGKPAAFVLYMLSVITLMVLLYLFLFRPCCCSGKRNKDAHAGNPLATGMMVLPVQGMPGGKKAKKGQGDKKGKKGKGGGGGGMGDVQVNLIVDPHAFGRREEEESDDGVDGDDWDGSVPGAYDAGSASAKRKRKRPRRSVFAGLAMEEEWKKARAWAKKVALFDAVGMVLWGAAFVFILIGKRCPSGGFEGWCNAYNVSSAAACLLCVAFGVSTFFNIKDLHASKVSPRTRT